MFGKLSNEDMASVCNIITGISKLSERNRAYILGYAEALVAQSEVKQPEEADPAPKKRGRPRKGGTAEVQ